VLTMAGAVYDPGWVLIDDAGLIAGVGRWKEGEVFFPAGTEIINAQGKVVMPGLVEAHCHVGILEEIYRDDGDDLNETTDPVTPHLRAIDAINPEDVAFNDALLGGVTTLGTGPGSANVFGGETAVLKSCPSPVVDRMVLRQPAGLKIALGENPKRIYGGQQKSPRTRMATAALLRQTLVAAENYGRRLGGEILAEDNKGKTASHPERDLKLEAVLRALRGEIPVRAHAHRADDIMTAIRIADEFGLRLTIEHGTEAHKVAPELAARNIPVVVGPLLSNRSKVELKDKDFRTPLLLYEAGVKIAFMTDHPVTPIQHLWLCAALAVKEGLPVEAALQAITINAAEILGVADRVGSLERGKDADILILSGAPLEISTRIEQVIINGKTVFEARPA